MAADGAVAVAVPGPVVPGVVAAVAGAFAIRTRRTDEHPDQLPVAQERQLNPDDLLPDPDDLEPNPDGLPQDPDDLQPNPDDRAQGHRVQGHLLQGHRAQGHRAQGHLVQDHLVQGHLAEEAEAVITTTTTLEEVGKAPAATTIASEP